MKIRKIDFSNYRSIQEATLEIDNFSTVLMGRNDVGKTNILKGLIDFGTKVNFSRTDSCRHAKPVGAEPCIKVQFHEFDENDRDGLNSLPIPLQPKDSLTISRTGNDPSGYSILVDNEEVHQNSEQSNQPTTSNEVAELPAPSTNRTTEWKNFINAIWKILPNVVQYNPPADLKTKVTIAQLESNSEEFRTVRQLLSIAGVTDYSQLASTEDAAGSRDRREEVGDIITSILRENWHQDTSLSLLIEFQDQSLQFIFREKTTKSTYPDQHSPATLEYISILADLLNRIRDTEITSSIILFDEPGIRLHPGGQRDLLALLRNLSKRFQIIYTTHSPHLLDRNYPGQVRLITKSETGTLINNRPYYERSTIQIPLAYEPVQTEIGDCMGDHLGFAEKNIIVEGPSDQMLLSCVSQLMVLSGQENHIDLNDTVIIPAGSAGLSETYAKMAKSRGHKVAILFDSDDAGQGELARIRKKIKDASGKYFLEDRELMGINNVFGDDNRARCIEDVFPRKLYHEAVNKFYGSLFEKDWKSTSPKVAFFKDTDKPIGCVFSDYFKDSDGLDGKMGEFDKARVGRELVNIIRGLEAERGAKKMLAELDDVVNIVKMLNGMLNGEPPKILVIAKKKGDDEAKNSE